METEELWLYQSKPGRPYLHQRSGSAWAGHQTLPVSYDEPLPLWYSSWKFMTPVRSLENTSDYLNRGTSTKHVSGVPQNHGRCENKGHREDRHSRGEEGRGTARGGVAPAAGSQSWKGTLTVTASLFQVCSWARRDVPVSVWVLTGALWIREMSVLRETRQRVYGRHTTATHL